MQIGNTVITTALHKEVTDTYHVFFPSDLKSCYNSRPKLPPTQLILFYRDQSIGENIYNIDKNVKIFQRNIVSDNIVAFHYHLSSPSLSLFFSLIKRYTRMAAQSGVQEGKWKRGSSIELLLTS